MKREVWLKTNGRAYLLLAILPASITLGCLLLCFATPSRFWWWLSSVFLIAASGCLLFVCLRACQPRLASTEGRLLVYLQGLRPIELPMDVVECFFLGQGASMLPHSLEGKQGEATETATVVVRLAEAAKEWTHRDVKPSLGQWCEGYITIRGTWCEPLSGELVANLNRRLVNAHRALKQAARETVQA